MNFFIDLTMNKLFGFLFLILLNSFELFAQCDSVRVNVQSVFSELYDSYNYQSETHYNAAGQITFVNSFQTDTVNGTQFPDWRMSYGYDSFGNCTLYVLESYQN